MGATAAAASTADLSAAVRAVAAREAYGARALELLCAGPAAVTDPLGGIWGLAAPKTFQTSELGIAAVGRDDHADIDEVGGVDLRGAGVH